MNDNQIDKTIQELEKSLPTPYYFKELLKIYRKLGKQAKKEGEYDQSLKYFNHMLSLSNIWHQVYGSKKSGIEGREVDEAVGFLNRFLETHQTLYPYSFAKDGPIQNDVLLSATDYKNLQQLSELIGQHQTTTRTKPKVRKSSKPSSRESGPGFGKEFIIYRQRSQTRTKGKALYHNANGQDVVIEQLVLEHYHTDGYRGFWSENDYWWQVMTLLYWDVVYAKFSDVFEPAFGSFPSQMQDIPQDIFTNEFHTRRQKMIEARHKSLVEPSLFGLRTPSPERELRSAWKKHKGKSCRFFDQWQKFSVDELALAPEVLSHSQLIEIMGRLLRDFNNNRRGLPDLFLANDKQPLFVEVKSERERIARHQLDWHKFLTQNVGVQVAICRVIEKQ